MTIEVIIKQIISDHLGVALDDIHLSSRLVDDLGADSLDAVELVMALEDKFEISIPDNEDLNLSTVQEMIDYVRKQK